MSDMTPSTFGNHRFAWICLGVSLLAIGIGWGVGRHRPSSDEKPTREVSSTSKRGKLLFQTMCATCHGPEGRGDGPSAVPLHPPPRDFAVRPWRFAVSSDSIRKVILDGIPGTAMPGSRGTLPSQDVEALTAYVLELAIARPVVRRELSEHAKLLRELGFTDYQGSPTPTLAVTNSVGTQHTLSDFEGRPVLVHFWGTQCLPCLREIPTLETLRRRPGLNSLVVLHVCVDAANVLEAQNLISEVAPGAKAWIDENDMTAIRFQVQALPTTWILDRKGRRIGTRTGATDWDSPKLYRLLKKLVETRS